MSITTERRHHLSAQAVNLGLGVNILLAGVKTAGGIFGHSPALLAEGINSTSDVAYYVVVSIFMRLARRPADDEHPYGHTQLESIAALIVGSFVIATAIAIFWNALDQIFDLFSGVSASEGAHPIALFVALVTVGIKIYLMIFTQRLARQTENPAVLALSYDHRNDIFSAAGAAAGIMLSQMGYAWGDPLAGALVALIILRTGVEIIRQSSIELMDAVPSRELADQVNDLVMQVGGVLALEAVHAHRFGPYLVMNVTIGVDGEITVAEGDLIACAVEDILYEHIELLRQVHVHYHPLTKPGDPVALAEEYSWPRRLHTLE
jgi:cation diffusion facilitator family transporter